MPELPEVETIRRQISNYLPLKVDKVYFSKVSGSIVKEKKKTLKGDTLNLIKRKGKAMDFHFQSGMRMFSQLGMSGSWQISDEDIKAKHTHIKLSCTDANGVFRSLAYVDPRRFGNAYITDKKGATERLDRLGVDVSTVELTKEILYEVFQKRARVPLKVLLLNQKYLSGIGNYMASEICALSKILPTRVSGDVTKRECEKIRKACRKIIDQSIKSNGMTFHGGYVDANGEKGEGVKNLVVFYQKECGMCGATVIKTELGGRGTYHCPKCQS